MSTVKKIALCAVCVALCAALPPAFHMLGPVASVLSPMHIPVLLCGLLCGWSYGAVCGVAGPLLSSLLTGMPPAAALVHMLPELCVYGLVCGVLMKLVRTGSAAADLYCAMAPAMLVGRVAGGAARTLFLLGKGQSYTLALWAVQRISGGNGVSYMENIGIACILCGLFPVSGLSACVGYSEVQSDWGCHPWSHMRGSAAVGQKGSRFWVSTTLSQCLKDH